MYGKLPSSQRKAFLNFSNQRAWPTIQKCLPLTWRQFSIHLYVLSGLGGIQTSDQSYWSIFPPWVDRGGSWFKESGTDFWLSFYSEPDNQYRVARFHLSSVPTWLGSCKVMRWGGCAPSGVVLRSVSWSPHSLTKSDNRLSHWVVVHRGSYRWGAWPGSEKVPL